MKENHRNEHLSYSFSGEEGNFKNLSSGKLMMWTFLASDVMGFISLISSYFYLKTQSVEWPDSEALLNLGTASVKTAFLLISSFTIKQAVVAIKRNDSKTAFLQLCLTIFLGILFLVTQGYEYFEVTHLFSSVFENRPFTGHVFASTFFLLTGYHATHVFVGLVYLGFISRAIAQRRYSSENYNAPDIAGLFWQFIAWIWIAVYLSLYFL